MARAGRVPGMGMSHVNAQVRHDTQTLHLLAGYDPPLGVSFLDVFDAAEPDEPLYTSLFEHPLGLSRSGEGELRADLEAWKLPVLPIMAAVQALGLTVNTFLQLGTLP
ncbi:hypothetical protein [Deinococcus ruber]|uniref:Uncharacterized protein n=1 Tax=Deinococcus ruber TaxID=1848197 RepID=A0A918CCG6_9DEIO|nr:hypothetical protein [Deinococcus ruber]GGR15676.1 hypothetical protein GCM10008957_30520 [Deinococcus ruber]